MGNKFTNLNMSKVVFDMHIAHVMYNIFNPVDRTKKQGKARQGPFARERGAGSGHGMVNQLNQLIDRWIANINKGISDLYIVYIW